MVRHLRLLPYLTSNFKIQADSFCATSHRTAALLDSLNIGSRQNEILMTATHGHVFS